MSSRKARNTAHGSVPTDGRTHRPPAKQTPTKRTARAAVTLRSAVVQVSHAWSHEADTGLLSRQTAKLYTRAAEGLLVFGTAHGITLIDEVTKDLVRAFVRAPGRDRHGHIIVTLVETGTHRQRRSGIASFYAHARALGLTQCDPLVDSPPIHRSPRKAGAGLTTDEIKLLQFHSERGMPATRDAALLALLLTGLHSAEIATAAITDLDLEACEITTAGATYTEARTCPLSDWARYVLGLRCACLAEKHPGQLLLVANARSAPDVAQSSVGSGFGDIARRSGLSTTARKVEPRDVTRFVAARILDETGSLSEVARRLGLSSLDSAAGLAGLQWKTPRTGGTA
ncbi:site-specific integrase [Streptomyces sp. NBC_00435]|uniref:site-specific integrase n=1 Tax=Streptomyces sp. NBC_00435 TaxID=2903649 RepID=UPI002E1A7CDA